MTAVAGENRKMDNKSTEERGESDHTSVEARSNPRKMTRSRIRRSQSGSR